MSNIVISGCDEQKLNKLIANESKTVWVKIPNDCSIGLTYKINGIKKKENIFGYATTMMGQKLEYDIGVD